jgi:hypothetical protein
LGNKNRILLGVLTSILLHRFRNIFDDKDVYITKLKYTRIKNKHPEIIHFIEKNNFQILLDNTIASCDYEEDGLYNFIALVDEKYILYSISINNFHNEVGTLFYIRKKQMIKCFQTINFFNEKYREDYLKEIN